MVVATPYRLAAPVAKAENDPAFGANEGLQRVRTAVGEVLEKEEVANHQEVRPVFPCLLVFPRRLAFLPLTLMVSSISAGSLSSLSSSPLSLSLFSPTSLVSPTSSPAPRRLQVLDVSARRADDMRTLVERTIERVFGEDAEEHGCVVLRN